MFLACLLAVSTQEGTALIPLVCFCFSGKKRNIPVFPGFCGDFFFYYSNKSICQNDFLSISIHMLNVFRWHADHLVSCAGNSVDFYKLTMTQSVALTFLGVLLVK